MSFSLVCAICATTVSIASMIRQLGAIQIAGGILFACQGTGHVDTLHPVIHSVWQCNHLPRAFLHAPLMVGVCRCGWVVVHVNNIHTHVHTHTYTHTCTRTHTHTHVHVHIHTHTYTHTHTHTHTHVHTHTHTHTHSTHNTHRYRQIHTSTHTGTHTHTCITHTRTSTHTHTHTHTQQFTITSVSIGVDKILINVTYIEVTHVTIYSSY